VSYGNGSFPFCVDLFFALSRNIFYWTLLFEKHGWCLIRNHNCLLFANTWLFGGPVRVAHLFSFLCCIVLFVFVMCLVPSGVRLSRWLPHRIFISILFTIDGLVYYLISKCWLRPSALFNRNHISGVIVGVLDSNAVDRVKPKTSGGGSRSTRREQPTMGNQLVNFIACGCEPSAPFFIYKVGREPSPYWW